MIGLIYLLGAVAWYIWFASVCKGCKKGVRFIVAITWPVWFGLLLALLVAKVVKWWKTSS